MKDITKSLPVVGEGEIEYQLLTDDDSKVTMRTKGYHIPGLSVWLFSPQIAAKEDSIFEFCIRAKHAILRFSDGKQVTIPYQIASKLPMLCVSLDIEASALALETSLNGQVDDETNQNL